MLVYEYRLHDIQKQLRGSMQQQKDEFLFSMCRGNINEKKVQEKLSKYEISIKKCSVRIYDVPIQGDRRIYYFV